MKLLRCNCRQCKAGRKRKLTRWLIEQKRSGVKSKVRQELKNGNFDNLPTKVYIGYTD